MYCNQKYSGAIKGFLVGSLLVFSLMLVSSNWNKNQTPKNAVSFDEAISRIKSDNIKKVRLDGRTAEFFNDEMMFSTAIVSDSQAELLFNAMDSANISVSAAPEAKNPLVYLFQILFWLFFISPPVIVILLLIIIKKLDARNSA